jgi:Collagen triple helix repeat (20 copies)
MFSKLRHPVRAIREPFGTAGLIVACVALIAALTGGAYAASGGLTAKQKKEVTKIAKKFAGAPGAAGPVGPAGTPGANGKDGSNGATGPAGPAGVNGPPGATGAQGETGEAGMCSQEEPECKLASGGLLTGVWTIGEGNPSPAAISFPVRVSPAPTAIGQAAFAGHTLGYQLKDGDTDFYGPYPCVQGCGGQGIFEQADPSLALEEAEAAYREVCPGSFGEPEAKSGFLCIYTGPQQSSTPPAPYSEALSAEAEAAHEFGVTVPYRVDAGTSGSGFVRGSWAVTG